MNSYILAHTIVNEHRNESLKKLQPGPSILILGSNFSGKTTLCHILCNYSLKLGWSPLYVDLDLNNEISLPGLIAATLVDYNLPVLYNQIISLIAFRMTF